jgi:hypothetical protein
MLAFPVIEGDLTHIETDEQGRITVLRLREYDGSEDEIRFTHPEPPLIDIVDDPVPVPSRLASPVAHIAVVRLR